MMSPEMMDTEELTPPSSPLLMGRSKYCPPCSPVLQSRLTSHPLSSPVLQNRPTAASACEELIFSDTEPVLFHCVGDSGGDTRYMAHSAGPLRHRVVSKLVEQKLNLPKYDSPVAEVFEFLFPACLVISRDIDRFFKMLKQRIGDLETFNALPSSGGSSSSGFRKRQELRKAFDYVLSSVSAKRDLNTAAIAIMDKMRQVVTYLGLLCELPQTRFSIFHLKPENKSLSSYQILHAHIEIWWACIEIFHTIAVNFPDSLAESRTMCTFRFFEDVNAFGVDLATEAVQLIVWDFVVLASQRHNTLSVDDYERVSMFPCSCVRELFIILIQYLRTRQLKSAKQSFWLILTPVLHHFLLSDQLTPRTDLEINSDTFLLPPSNVSSKEPIGLCWWVLIQVAPLYQFDESGNFNAADIPVLDCYNFVQTLVEKSLPSSESRLRCWLRCLIGLLKIWEKNSKIISILWDHFYRKLNDQLLIPELSISSLASISLSASDMLERCQKLTHSDGIAKQDNSYFLFLRILHIYLSGTHSGSKSSTEWRQIKGRLFSKFSSRKMQELNEMGLHNLTSLFLVLAQVVDIEDVSGKLLELYSAFEDSSQEFFRRRMLWKAILALCLLYVKRRMDVSSLAEKLVSLFQKACEELRYSKFSVDCRNELWKLFQIYFDGVQDIIDSSEQFDLHEEKLLGNGFQELLTASRNSEMVEILSFLQSIFTKHRIVHKRILQCGGHISRLIGLSNALWKSAYAFVKQRSTSTESYIPPQLADVAASYTLLAIHFFPGQNSGIWDKFVDCFQFFGCNDQVDVSISSRFMCHMLPNQSVVEKLSSDFPDFERHVIKSWFRMAWYMDPASDCMQELARQISKLPAFISVFRQTNADIPDSSTCPVRFIEAIGSGYSSLPPMDMLRRTEYRNKALDFFGDVVKHCTLKDTASRDQANLVYNLAGHIVQHCAQMTYLKSNPYCLFPIILEKLCLPRSVLTAKDLPPYLVPALKHHLHLFVLGLSSLDFRRDPYLQRKLREIVIHHLLRFQQMSSVVLVTTISSVHPLAMALSPSYSDVVSEEASAFRQNLYEIVRDEFLSRYNGHDTPKALSFLISVEEKIKNPVEIAKDSLILLPACLNFILMARTKSEKELALHLKGLFLDAYKRIPPSSSVFDAVRSILRDFIQNITIYQSLVFKVLDDIALIQPSLFTDLIPAITETIKNFELKKDLVVDKQLRMNYFVFLSKLGDAGDAEKIKLMQNKC